MKKSITKINFQALAQFEKTLELANQALEEGQHRPAEWFDTPAKRLQWWLDLEPQWRQAFNEAVFQKRRMENSRDYQPTDEELQFLFGLDTLMVCGTGAFKHRNNFPDISFQLTNLTGVQNLTNLRRIECDYNGQIDSLEPLRNLVNLRVLWCDNNRIEDLSPLMGLHNLTRLCCWNNRIRSLEPIATLLQLEDLTLGLYDQGNPLESITPLQYLTNLRHLHLNACRVKSLEPLGRLHRLEVLYAQKNDIESLAPILHLERLRGYFYENPRLRPEEYFLRPGGRGR